MGERILLVLCPLPEGPKFAGARKSSLLPSQSSTLLPFAHTHTLSNLPRQTHTNPSAILETSAIELLLLSSNSSTEIPSVIAIAFHSPKHG